jgi:hypothetical protein
MNISKSDFKIIFHKMMNSDNQIVNKYIKNLTSNGKTGDEDIDKIIKNYNSEYILKVINKINKKVLVGGDEPTSQEAPKTEVVTIPASKPDENKNKKLESINVVDNVSGKVSTVPVEQTKNTNGSASVTSSEVSSIFAEQPKAVSDLSVTSSELPKMVTDLSATSSEMPLPRDSKQPESIFIKSESATSSDLPPSIQSEQMSATSSVVPGLITSTSIEIPEPVTKTELADIFVPEKKEEKTSIKLSIKELIEKLKVKSKLLNDKEAELKNKENELDNRQKIIVQLEEDSKRKLDEINTQLNELKTKKEQLNTEVNNLRVDSEKLEESLSDIQLSEADLKITETESKPVASLLNKIFGN